MRHNFERQEIKDMHVVRGCACVCDWCAKLLIGQTTFKIMEQVKKYGKDRGHLTSCAPAAAQNVITKNFCT